MPQTAPGRRLATLVLLLAAAAGSARAVDASAGSLVIVEPDVELVVARDGAAAVLPSATRSEAFVRAWPEAAAAALGLEGAPATWTPPGDIRHDDDLGQVLALQEAVATALIEQDAPPRELSLGPGAARLAAATGATHALFARIHASRRRGTAVAMLVDLRTGALQRHGVVTGIDAGADPRSLATRVAGRLPGAWRDLPDVTFAEPRANAPMPAATDDVARAAARLERRLRRHPARVDDPEIDAMLRSVACRLDAERCGSLRPIVLAQPGAHAAILPGGALVLHTGLLLRLRDEAELAFVVAHELAHERAGDVRARLAAGRDGFRDDAARSREQAADRDAFARIAAAGYDPSAAVDLWTRLVDEERAGAPAALPGSHPSAADRLDAARAASAGARGGERGAARWEALAAPRRARWREDEAGNRGATWQAVPVAAAPPADRTMRSLGLRLPTDLPWRQRPGVGAVAWTIDGTPLNRLLIVSGVARGRPLLHDVAADATRWDGTSGPAATAVIAMALRRSGWIGVRTGGDRPHDFGGVAGRRVELALADAGGLHYRGTMAHVVREGRLTWALWVAPEGAFHDRDAAAVAAMLDGLRFAR